MDEIRPWVGPPPSQALSINSPQPADLHVVNARAGNKRGPVATAGPTAFRQHLQHGPAVDLQIDAVGQDDRTAQVRTQRAICRYLNRAAARRGGRIDSALNRDGVVGGAIADRAEV